MADQKISQLTGATTPLAGTEVLPIVQSSTTKKVSVANLTAGRDVSMDSATINGHANVLGGDVRFDAERLVYSYAGGTVGQYRSGTYYDGTGLKQVIYLNNAEVGRWTGTDLQIKSGNFVPSTAAKGVNFTANTPAANMTSQLLNWYEEGTFDPRLSFATGGDTCSYAARVGRYTRIGRLVTVNLYVALTAKGAGTGNVSLINLPFTAGSYANAVPRVVNVSSTGTISAYIYSGQSVFTFFSVSTAGTETQLTDTNITDTTELFLTLSYIV